MDRDEAKYCLSEFVLGQLPEDQAVAVSAHLASDKELQRLEEFLRWVQPHLLEIRDHFPGDHPTGEELVNSALGQGEFPNEREDWVRKHLATCADCRKLEASIRNADNQLTHDELRSDRRPNRWTIWATAAVLAVALFVSGTWWGNRDGDLESGPQVVAVHLSGTARGEASDVEISPTENGSLPRLVLEFDPWVGRTSADDFQLEILVLSAETRQVVQSSSIGAEAGWSADDGGVRLDSARGNWSPGNYLIEARDDAGTIIFQTGFHLLPQ